MKKRKLLFTIIPIILILIGVSIVMICKFGTKKDENPLIPLSAPFVKVEIYSDDLYVEGLVPQKDSSVTVASLAEASGEASIVLPVKYGKTYEMHFPKELSSLFVVVMSFDPHKIQSGSQMPAKEIRWGAQVPDLSGLLYTPSKNEYLVIYTAPEKAPISIIEHTIIDVNADAEGPWYKPEVRSDFFGEEGSFADYRWGSDEIYSNLYDTLVQEHPEYITREYMGKDQSEQYDMYAYIFEPENYETTVFLSSGMHANEEDAYFALAYFMRDIADADGTDELLSYVRSRVRFIVVPLINVWGTHGTHRLDDANWAIRYNYTGTDLNRDFGNLTQAETRNVAALLAKYADGISYGVDFHTTPNDNGYDLFFNFPICIDNAEVNFRTVNHVYHRMTEEGMISSYRPILVPSSEQYGNIAAIDGGYSKASSIQSYLWQEHGIPPITVEYMNLTSGENPDKGSAEGLCMAVEIFGNFIIQNALYYLD